MPGRKKIPSEIKKAKGTYYPSRELKDEMQLDAVPEEIRDEIKDVKDSQFINTYARDEWDTQCTHLVQYGIVAHADVTLLITYCNEVGIYYECIDDLKKNGLKSYKINKAGEVYESINPSYNIANKAQAAFTKIGVLFGLTPSARAKIPKPKDNKEEEEMF